MLQFSQKVTVQGIDIFMLCRLRKIVGIWAVCRDFVPSGERKDFFCNDVKKFFTTTRSRRRDLLPLLFLQTRTFSSCHVLREVRVVLVLVAFLLV